MDISKFLADANALMPEMTKFVSNAWVFGSAVGTVVHKGKEIIAVWFSRRQPKKGEEPKATADVKPVEASEPITAKGDVAILVDINQRSLVDVGAFLEKQNIDADLIIVTNDPSYEAQVKFLDPRSPEKWTEIAREFNVALKKIKRAVGGARLHIFLATPLPLAFALGCIMGTVDEGAVVYHWQEKNYWPVVTITRDLRQ